MKASLTFDLPEDQNEFRVATRAMDLALVVLGLEKELRDIVRYGTKYEEKIIDRGAADEIRGMLRDILKSYNLTLDMIE